MICLVWVWLLVLVLLKLPCLSDCLFVLVVCYLWYSCLCVDCLVLVF